MPPVSDPPLQIRNEARRLSVGCPNYPPTEQVKASSQRHARFVAEASIPSEPQVHVSRMTTLTSRRSLLVNKSPQNGLSSIGGELVAGAP
jgi:hypothetical protein